MASSSSSLSNIRRYHVFTSFHGPDVRRGFLSHLHNHFATKGITAFNDQEIERGHTIGPELVQAIRESRVSIVLLSKNYASSSWCLDELVEILKCKENQGKTLMTIFYDVDPSDVRKQRGDFGSTFMKTCEGKSEGEKKTWSEALAYVATVAGEHSLNWEDEAKMIEKIAIDVLNKLNLTPSKDFDGMVGMEGHLRQVNSYLRLECNEVKMIGIQGPAGIGKTTIARALFDQLSADFELKCFMDNIKGSCGSDDHVSKLSLQSQLLSKILKQKDLKISHLGKIKEWLQDQKVLIVLDDVDDLEQLEVLAKEPSWFGLGSRIIVTTEDRKILKAHWVDDTYHVGYPSEKEALEILCLSAFKQSSPRDGFEDLAKKIANLCGSLPLGLHIVGLSLRGERMRKWESQLSKVESILDRKIEDVLKLGYDKLLDGDQSLFLHIAFFFNNQSVDYVTTMLADSNLDVANGLETLADKSLVYVSTSGWITMHCLLQQLARKIVHQQSNEPGKRQFLVEAEEILDVLANKTGTGSVLGISLDTPKKSEFSISGQAFEGMRNLRFLRIYGRYVSALQIAGDMEFLPRLRLLHWNSYPRRSLPSTFELERLVELHMPMSNLERLWGGTQNLTNLKDINLGYSKNLMEIPDLSKANNLETLTLTSCTSLVELPSSIRNLHKLEKLMMMGCVKLQVVPSNINLASLEEVNMSDCIELRSYPDISSSIKDLDIENTKMEVHLSIVGCLPVLEWLRIGGGNLRKLKHVPENVTHLDLSNSVVECLPVCVQGLRRLESLFVYRCRKLVSLVWLPPSLKYINANECESLEKVSFLFNNPMREVEFQNCLKLKEGSRRVIMQRRAHDNICLPGKELPAEFTHKTTGSSLIIPMVLEGKRNSPTSSRLEFKACLLLSPIKFSHLDIACRITEAGVTIKELKWDQMNVSNFLTEHLFICGGSLVQEAPKIDVSTNEIQFEFSCRESIKIIECGVQILSEVAEYSSGSKMSSEIETEGSCYKPEAVQVSQGEVVQFSQGEAVQVSQGEVVQVSQREVVQVSPRKNVHISKYTCLWSWLCCGKQDEEYDDDTHPLMTHMKENEELEAVPVLDFGHYIYGMVPNEPMVPNVPKVPNVAMALSVSKYSSYKRILNENPNVSSSPIMIRKEEKGVSIYNIYSPSDYNSYSL